MSNTTKTKTVLMIGNGAREHAMIKAILNSPLLKKLYTTEAQFGDGTEVVSIDPDNFLLISHFCKNNAVDLVVIGQEKYLANGLSDVLSREGIAVFGPSKSAAKLEASKAFTKELCEMHNIPTAKYGSFVNADAAKQYAVKIKGKIVVKADGLAAGKGVFICDTIEEAYEAIERIIVHKEFGSSGNGIIIEEFLEGEEISVFIVSDGKNIIQFGAARDYKHVYYGGKLYNSGGMGAYSYKGIISPQIEQKIIREIIYPTINGLSEIDVPYCGFLFAGIMLTKSGPKLLEYNVRLGDPEAQVLLSLLKSDFLDLMLKTIRGRLSEYVITFDEQKAALCVVMASHGYPKEYKAGVEITGIKEASKVEGINIFYAGIKVVDGKFYSNGGRVLNVVAVADNLSLARDAAYSCIGLYLQQNDLFYLDDIGEV